MKLKEVLDDYSVNYIEDIPYFKVNDFTYFYCTLKSKEYLGVCLNKSLVRKSDLKYINQQCRPFAKITCDSIALKNDLLYIELLNQDNLMDKLNRISKLLKSMNYVQRKNCVLCGNKVDIHKFHQFLFPIDEKCWTNLEMERKRYSTNQKDYFKKSFLYGLIGAFIGIIPSTIIAFILESYSIISTILLFLSPFLTVIFFYKTKIFRTKKNDLICSLISVVFVLIYHLILILICVHAHQITSIQMYFTILKNYVFESLIETVFVYWIGLISAQFLTKPKTFIRLKKTL